MVVRVIVEQFYENLEEATIGRWIKAVGDPVQAGEPLVEIITDKITFEMESPGAGIIRSIVAPEKSVLPVGFIIALLGETEDALPDVSEHNEAMVARRKREVDSASAAVTEQTSTTPLDASSSAERSVRDRGKVRATPAARRAARDNNIDLAEVAATIPGDLVQEEDVLRWMKERSQRRGVFRDG